ncbi:hypothetical protein A3I27_04020 [Candidatus Giovannonibacteria bacterium RIFCSPLOWO2_02_FULL_43_11b]|uniref:Uncharacterized protein n=2 Tax=Parcubacteria group TaxID=1794811 RepID=A0A1F6W7W2_9BACT|nr:MAG: hypothetical protein A3F23_00475 [Candidatus Giovannonibacteria bacterium RIFCSPHIGHO2_12_FULL_43_15]OGF90428.1 MAG: hypothetical protein A3I27_04020 [Candidatus Giovannonibacteria bacterium RIFCSPLOWO2_02_FULL_43_11b]OGF91760.1 MAG: hypothetical protein A3H04_00985 [Candidatus Giovannonibacteria bacterium RIFCSPLOWO2_12_FULL_43_11c]OGI77969.1 MAG: hypothetical protein A3D42_03430 [Candidatus Nomurabacteria bacterium RIFCSPHIGHO2_02_FULL_41_18]OGI90054.1 MAG: hypothetical protein A3B01_
MKSQDAEADHSHSEYIITCDLGNNIARLRHASLKTPKPNDPFFKEFQKEIAHRIESALPKVRVRTINMEDLAEEILEKALEKKSLLKNAAVISTCVEIAAPRRGHTIEINRIVDLNGKILGLGSRPGHPTIDVQIEGILSLAGRQPVVLVEDGSFTGNTICYILKKLRERGLTVDAIVLGIGFPKALENIARVFNGEVHTVEKFNHLIDWMPDHDFFPFSPNCGRVFGIRLADGEIFPFYTNDGASYCFPYNSPFGRLTDWASVPKEAVVSLSLFCLSQAIELFQRLEKMNDKRIRIADLREVKPAVSIPISVGQRELPRTNTRIIDLLNDACQELS